MELLKKMWRNTHLKCPNCEDGRIWLVGNDVIGFNNIHINVYECDRCERKFV